MKHIDEFTIERFRGLRDLKLEGLGQINLLVGDNNVGKTSVLEALSVFCDPLNADKWLGMLDPQDTLTNQLPWIFPQGKNSSTGENPEILLHAVGEVPHEKVSARYEKFSEINPDNPVHFLEDVSGRRMGFPGKSAGIRIQVSTSMRDQLQASSTSEDLSGTFVFYDNRSVPVDEYKSYVLPVQIISPISHRFSGLSARLWSEVVGANLEQRTIELLRLFDADIEDIDIVSVQGQALVSVKHKKLGQAPLTTFGDGLQRVFTLATTIPVVRNGLLLVDELEVALHTDMLEKTFNWLVRASAQNGVQLFATTHSLEAVDAVISACNDEAIDLVAYRLERYKGQTVATRFNKKLLMRLRENLGMEVR